MKLQSFVIVSLVLFAAPGLPGQQRFFLGATAGAGSMHLSGDVPDNGSYTSKTGFSLGVIAEYALWPDLHLSLQPSYFQRGTGVAFDVGELDPRDSLDLTLDYLSIPLVARFLTPGSSWFINGGVTLDFLLDASMKNVPTGTTRSVKDLVNSVDLAMLFGGGKVFQLDPAQLSVEFRYQQSLVNAGANDQLASKLGMAPRFRSAGFQLLVAILYPL